MAQAVGRKRELKVASLQEMAQTLVRILGRSPVAYILGIRSLKTITRWTTGEVTSIRDSEVERKLINTYQIVAYLLSEGEGDDTIRMWMFGMEPALDDEAPIIELQKGNFKDVQGAANAMVWGLYA